MTKDGRFSYRQIFSYLSDGQYPPAWFFRADKSVGFTKESQIFRNVPTFITVVEVRRYKYCV